MAIDPALLAALTNGASAGAKTSNVGSSTGIDWGKAKTNQPGAWNLGQSIIDILSTVNYSVAGITRKYGENVAAIQRGDLGGLADLLNPLSVIPAAGKGIAERRTFAPNLVDLGVDKKTAVWLGLALDIGLDPTTWVTGGTIAGVKGAAKGVKLASAANKANAVVVRSAADAAAMNIPNMAKGYKVVDETLTQGQKLGNYLTGVLRGHEYSTSVRSAEILNKKLAKKIQKNTAKEIKAGNYANVAKADEFIDGIESYAKSSSAVVADNLAVIKRQELMDAIAKNPTIANRYAGKIAKYKKAVDDATNTKFDGVQSASEATNEAMLSVIKASDEAPSAAKEIDALSKPAEAEKLENAIAADKAANPVDYAAILKKQKIAAQGSASKIRSRVKSSYDVLADDLVRFASRVDDPAAKKKISGFEGTREQLVEYVANELSAGRLALSTYWANRIARTIGVSADSQQSKVDLVNKTILNFTNDLKKLSNKEAEVLQLGNQLARGVESGFINANTENMAAMGGAVDPAGVGRELENTLGLEAQMANVASDLINTNLLGAPQATAKTAEELSNDVTELMKPTAQQLADDIGFMESGKYTSSRVNILVPLQSFAPKVAAKAEEIAKKLGVKTEDFLYKAADENKAVLNDPNFLLSKDAIRLDYINSEARFTINNKIFANVLANTGKSGRTRIDQVEEEVRAGRAIDNIFRFFMIPVKTVENLPMQLRRDGQKMVGDKLSDNFLPAESHITYSDIGRAAIDSGKGDVFGALRYPGGKYQNVMPSNFEYAFLKIQQLQASGKTITRGTAEWDEVKKAFNEKYDFNYKDGVEANQVAVNDLFIEARHLNPGKTPKGKQLAIIPGLDAKIEAAMQVMVDSSAELSAIHRGRAAAIMATAIADEMPAAKEALSKLIETAALREEFLRGVGKLEAAGGNALRQGLDEIPGWDSLAVSITDLLVNGTKGAKLFKNPKLASSVRDMMINTIMKSFFGGTGKETLKALDSLSPARAAVLKSSLISLTSDLRDKLLTKINLENALGVTKPSTQFSKEVVRQGMNARNSAARVQVEGVGSFVPAAIRGQDSGVIEAIASGKKATDTSSNLPSNVAANVDPYAAGFENIATAMLTEIKNLKFPEKIAKAFSATFGVGKAAQQVMGGITTWNYNSVGLFRNSLTSIFLKHKKDMTAINTGFKVLQNYGKQMAEAVETGVKGLPLEDWLTAQKITGATADVARDMMVAVNALFGDLGSAKDTIKLPYFAEELNVMFGMEDFWKKGSGKGFTLPPKLGPEGIKYSWADAELDDTFNALELLSGYASAIHAVKTKIGIGATYSRLFGKTAKEIVDEGLEKTQFVKIDQSDELGKYLDPDAYFDAEQFEKLRYVKDYLMYKKSFNKATQRVVDFSDMITSFLKASHTTWRPGHHVTSIVGEAAMNTMAGVTNPKYYFHAARLLKKLNPKEVKGDENIFKQYAQVSTPEGMQIKGSSFDGIGYISNKNLMKTVLDDDGILSSIERNQVVTRAGYSTVEDLDNRGIGEFTNNLLGSVSRANGGLAKFSSARDNLFRVAHYLHELENGGIYSSFEEASAAAARKVTEWHPTVGGLSAFERKYMRRAVFFYTWQRLAATKVFELTLERPGIVIIPSKIQYAFAEANGFNPESFGDPWDPNGVYASWDTKSAYGPQFQGPAGSGDAWGFSPAIPTVDIINSLLGNYTIQPGESGLDALVSGTQTLAGQNLSPLPKWFAELTTGNRVGIGGDIRNPLEYAIDQVGGINTLSKITGIGREPDLGITPTEEAEKKARLLINFTLGQKLKDYSTDDSVKQWKKDQTMMLQRLTGQE
jgi:hypothetical protein